MVSKFLNLSTDNTLGGNSASDTTVSSQKAIKSYIDSHSGDSYTAGDGIVIENGEISVDGSNVEEIDTETPTELALATVATTGSFNDLSNKPTIPTTTSSVISGSTAALTSGGAYTALQSYQTTANLVTSVSSSSTDSQYPSAKLFYDTCGDIETLINAL